MKQILGYRGEMVIEELPVPLIGPYDVKIKVFSSVYSAGTESHRLNGQSKKSFLTKISSYKAVWGKISRFKIQETLAKYRKFKGYYAQLGYSCYGKVVEVGCNVEKNIEVGDLVAAGGESAFHASYVSVPQGLVTKCNGLHSNNFSMVYLATIPINSCNQILKDSPSKVLIVGGGVIGTLASLYLDTKKVKNMILDPNENCIFGRNEKKSWLKSHNEITTKYDALLITTGSIQNMDDYYQYLNKEVHVNILGEIELNAFTKGQIEELYGKISFCNSFGYGRRDAELEILNKNIQPRLKTTSSLNNNVNDAINFLKNADLRKFTKLHSVEKDLTQIDRNTINIFEYRDLK